MKPSDVSGAIKAYVAATKKETASPEEVLRRSKICLACPMRVRTRGISRVSKFLGELARINNADKKISEFSCGVCSCSLLLLTTALPENLHQDNEKQKQKRNKTACWMKL